jgi:hypothetical protein
MIIHIIMSITIHGVDIIQMIIGILPKYFVGFII